MSLTGLGEVSDLIKDVADKLWPDANEREKNLALLDTQIAAAQAAIDQQEAGSENLFVAGWRPFIGWVCGSAFAYHFILQPFLTYILAVFGKTILLPTFDMNTLSTVLMGMLGLGSLRTVEKMNTKLPWQK